MKPKTYLLSILLLSISLALHAQTADEILEKHAAAMGGMENWNKIKTLKITGTIYQQWAEIPFTFIIDQGKMLKSTTTLNGSSTEFTEYLKDETKTATNPDPNTSFISNDSALFFRPHLNMPASLLIDYKTNGMTATYTGMDTILTKPCFVLKLVTKKGLKITAFIDQTTYYLLRMETILKNDEGPKEVSVSYKLFRNQDGVVIPFSCHNNIKGNEFTKETLIKTIEVNPKP